MSNIYKQYQKDDELFREVIRSDEIYKHRDRMTVEGLHSKSDIAAELAYRDIQLKKVEARVKELEDICSVMTVFASHSEEYEQARKLWHRLQEQSQ